MKKWYAYSGTLRLEFWTKRGAFKWVEDHPTYDWTVGRKHQ